jgi:hypothetical protein
MLFLEVVPLSNLKQLKKKKAKSVLLATCITLSISPLYLSEKNKCTLHL